MTEPAIGFNREGYAQYEKIAREVTRRMMNVRPDRARWQQQRGGGTVQIRWGTVSESIGCGWYTVELGTLDGEYDASMSLSASGDECSPCQNVVGSGTSNCSIDLIYPPPRVIGSGVYVPVYDPASLLIPLVVGTDCVVGKIPGAVPAGSGSGGSAAGATEATWAMLRGFQQHSVDYKERWDCCEPNGPPVLIGKTPIVFVGFACDEIICGECPE